MEKVEQLYERIGFGHRVGFGERPALILIDYFRAATDPSVSPLGFDQSEAILHSKRVLEVSREKAIPIIFTTIVYTDTEHYSDAGMLIKKIPSLKGMVPGSKGVEIDERVKPKPNEHVIVKKFQSAFFGTNLVPLLMALKVDTTVLVGCATSSCVRATCFDSCSYGFRTIIPKECVADRDPAVHEANLFDMDSKDADVVSVEEVLNYLHGLQPFQVAQ